MKKQENNKHLIKSVSIVLLSLAVFILIFAIIIKIQDYKKSSYKIDVKFETNDIVKLTNKLPMSDEIGKEYTGTGVEKGIIEYKEFTVSNPNEGKVSYEIYLTRTENSIEDMKSGYIKLYLTDEKNKPVEGFDTKKLPTFYDLPSLSDKLSSRLLYTGTLVSGSSKKYILRTWIADTYVLSDTVEDFGFDIDVRIK